MPVIVKNQFSDAAPTAGIISLLNNGNIGSDLLAVDHVRLEAGSQHNFETGSSDLFWLCVLQGQGALNDDPFTTSHIAALPPGSIGTVRAETDLAFLWTRVPDAKQFDPEIVTKGAPIKITDWRREPVLQSEHDSRTRVYMATPTLSGTKAIKSEMITYPPGTEAPEHHHEGAEHFQFVTAGSGVAVLDGARHVLSAGDILYNYENEPHYFYNEADSGTDFQFIEFFVPGECKTIWAPNANHCAWLPTGRDSAGQKPVRDIGYHVHGKEGRI